MADFFRTGNGAAFSRDSVVVVQEVTACFVLSWSFNWPHGAAQKKPPGRSTTGRHTETLLSAGVSNSNGQIQSPAGLQGCSRGVRVE
jgi:hypothetical protein